MTTRDDPGLPEETPEQEAEFRRKINAVLDERARAREATTASLEGDMETYHGFKLKPVNALPGGVPVYEFADLPSIVPEDAVPISGSDPDAREWTSVIALSGVPTSDGRMLGADVGWRELPLTLMALLTTDEGHKGAFVAGRIDSIEQMPAAAAITAGLLSAPETPFPPDAVAYVGRGVFDDSWAGDEVMRLVASETLRGVSIDLAPEAVEVVEMPLAEGDTETTYLEIVTRGEIMGATVCPFPAFKEATIRVDSIGVESSEPVEEPVVASMRSRRPLRVVVAAAIVVNAPRVLAARDYSDGSMIAVHPTAEQCSALALEGGQPAGDLHCTLAFLPHPENVDFAKLNDVVAGVADAHDAIEGTVGGAGYFAAAPAAPPPAPEKPGTPDGDEVGDLAATPPAVADPETPADSEGEQGPGQGGDGNEEPLHPHVALVDAPGLSRMRSALCDAMDDAGIEYAQNHDFTPHITLGYEATPGVPAVAHGGQPVSFGHIAVHEGLNRTAHALRGRESMTASAAGLAPDAPPAEWFADPGLSEPTPLTITDEGRIYGHLATWGTCHVGLREACVQPPTSATDYALFHLGHVLAAEGDLVPVGTFTMDTGHAGLALGLRATQAHYDNTGTAVADVRVGEDETGIWFAGAIRPDLDARKVRALRAAQISGDWRPHEGSREFCAGLAVNVPGYPVVRPRTAVAASGQLLGLIAAGVDLAAPEATRSRVLELAERAHPGYLDERRDALAARVR